MEKSDFVKNTTELSDEIETRPLLLMRQYNCTDPRSLYQSQILNDIPKDYFNYLNIYTEESENERELKSQILEYSIIDKIPEKNIKLILEKDPRLFLKFLTKREDDFPKKIQLRNDFIKKY